MSPKNSLLATGLTALGLLGTARYSDADPPKSQPGSATPVAPAAPSQAVLLLTDGGVKQGLVSVDPAGYILHVRGSKLPYAKNKVVGMFRSIDEAYEFRRSQLPERDPDENMKLARWCLTTGLQDKAKEQLDAVLALSPTNVEAKNMLDKINDLESRRAVKDTEVVQASVEMVDSRMDPLERRRLDQASREMGVSGLLQIEGISKAATVRRVEEFRRNVHGVLQTRCARCHNEKYDGEFRLVLIKTRGDATTDAIRHNLDAALRLVDWENPTKSELLSSTLRPHGLGSSKRPIFSGSNDRSYQILAQWINNLHASQRKSESMAKPQPFLTVEPDQGDGERFASRRKDGMQLPLTPTPTTSSRPQPPEVFHEPTPMAPGQMLPGSGSSMQPYAPEGTEFPVSYLQGGPAPKVARTPEELEAEQMRKLLAAPGAQPPPEGAAPAAVPQKPGNPAQAKAKKPANPVKLDPALLQKALMNRNQ